METESTVNAPHVDEDEEAFFGGDFENGDGEAAAEPDPADFNPETGDFDTSGDKPDDPKTEEPPAETPAEEVKAADEPKKEPKAEKEKKRGPIEREYIVFQKVPMTKAALQHLLKLVESGDEGKVRTAYFEVARSESRNVEQAVGAVYLANQGSLGEKGATLAAVSSKSFQERTVKPKQNVETILDIS